MFVGNRNGKQLLFSVGIGSDRGGCLGAFAIYFALNTLLKMPFSKEFLDSGTLGANLIRTARYAVILFIVIGVYPRIFPVFEKIRIK